MLSNVCSQDTRCCECLVAVDTLVRSLATVHPHVLVETRGLTEAFAADRALVRSMLLMHMKDVDSQAIALLKAASAQMTGKLAIPLINASCILQVLVAVVLIRKDLATTVTCISVLVLGSVLTDLVCHVLQRHWYTEKLKVTITIPDEQLLALGYILAHLVKDVTF